MRLIKTTYAAIVVGLIGWLAFGCSVHKPETGPALSVLTHVTCDDRSVRDIAMLCPEQAKVVLIARAAGVDLMDDGMESAAENFEELTYDVFGTRGGWYAHCSGGWVGEGRTAFIDRSWNPVSVVAGPPPPKVADPSRDSTVQDNAASKVPPPGSLYAMPKISAHEPLRHVKCTDRSVEEIVLLGTCVAKAVLLARAAGIDLSPGGSGGNSYGRLQVTYDVFIASSGWYVYCHGGWLGEPGRTVFVDKRWNPSQRASGPPPGLPRATDG